MVELNCERHIRTEIMVEILRIFGIATKELRQGSISASSFRCLCIVTELRIAKFLKKLSGRTDLEDALKNLNRLTQEGAHLAFDELLRATLGVHDRVRVVDGKNGDTINQG